MWILAGKFRLILHSSFSLKNKRHIVKNIKNTLSNKYNISIAEIEDLDIYNYATIGYCSCRNARDILEKEYKKIEKFLNDIVEIEIQFNDFEIIRY